MDNKMNEIKNVDYLTMLKTESDFYVAKDISEYGSKTYFNMSLDDLFEFTQTDYHLYEYIKGDKPCKMYFDFDGKFEEMTEDEKVYFKENKNMAQLLSQHIKDFCEDNSLTKPKCIISGSSTDVKKSYHIAIDNIILPTHLHRKAFFNKFIDSIEEQPIARFFDSCVYSKSQPMRMINQSKMSKKVPLKSISKNTPFTSHLITYIKNKKITDIPEEWLEKKKEYVPRDEDDDEDVDYSELRKHLSNISRNETYKDWTIVGQVLLNLTNGDDEGLDMFVDWSRSASNFDYGGCERFWSSNKPNNNYGIGVLINMLDKVEPSLLPRVRLIPKEETKKSDDLSIPETDEEIGKYLVDLMVKSKNVYYSSKKKTVFIYNELSCIFEEEYDVEKLFKFISKPIIELVNKVLVELPNNDENKPILKRLNKLRKDIQSTSRQKSVFKQIKTYIPNSDEFIEKTFNCIPYLFPIANNKTINFKTLEVRDRVREDYFTYTTDNVFKEDRLGKEKVHTYIRALLKTENEDFVKTFLTWYGYCLTGENCVKALVFNTGSGDNGKTVFHNLHKDVCGKSWVIANDKVFLQSKSNSVHFDEILPLIGKRSASIQEIDRESTFNERILKTISGNDGLISVRGCGGKTTEESITCKLNAFCNSDDLPPFKDKQGFANRVKIFPFTNKFKKDAKKAIEIAMLKDDYFTELCFYVKEFFYDNDMEISFCKEVEDATNDYKDEVDTVKQYFNEKIIITGLNTDKILKQDIYTEYRSFCLENDYKNVITRNKFYKNMEEDYKLELYRKTHYNGVKYVSSIIEEVEN